MNRAQWLSRAAALLFCACRREEPAPPVEPPPTPAAVIAKLPALDGPWLRPLLDDEGQAVAMVAAPLGASTPRPVVIGVHAAAGRPDNLCSGLRSVFGPAPFVLCVHPHPELERRISWGSGAQIHSAIARALEVLRQRYQPYLDLTRLLYFGHSQGGILLPDAYAKPAAVPFSAVILFEGLPRAPQRPQLRHALTRMGARRVLLVSGQSGWAQAHRELARSLGEHGFDAKHVAGGFGHFFNEEATALLRRELPALLEPVAPDGGVE